ncbi:MAG TPA: HAMP domain-containing sensor histidine kinase [Pilimelia sp.]|nr:HAMP domain-containing sensor histidine kinase [Pilimelia sp.]
MTTVQFTAMVAELLYGVAFVRGGWSYTRSRNPTQLRIALVALPAVVILVVDTLAWCGAGVPHTLRVASRSLLLLQPYLMLLLASSLRRVPGWLHAAVVTGFLLVGLPVPALPWPTEVPVPGVNALYYLAVQLVAAGYFAAEARRRAGASAARLTLACAAAVIAGISVYATSMESVPAVHLPARLLGVTAGTCYLLAFLPPRWLRAVWSARAAHTVGRRLGEAPATESADRIWARYTAVVREVSAADAVTVAVRADGGLTHAGTAGLPVPLAGATPAQLDALLAAPQPVDLTRRRPAPPDLAARYALLLPQVRYLTCLPVHIPPAQRSGALVLLNRRWPLFGEDDVSLLADLAAQAGILAARAEVVAAARRASEAKSAFLAAMSHELRTPLNAILGFSDLMLTGPAEGGHVTVPVEWAHYVHASGRRLLDLVNDVLDLSKVEAGQVDLQLERVAVAGAVSDVLAGVRLAVQEKRIEVRVRVPEDLRAAADAKRLRQILDNLLTNAIKYTPTGGWITVAGDRAADGVCLSVADSGCGIDAADRERVFARFQQVGDPARRQPGTGLGLALARRLARAHGGDITLDDAPGGGARFTLALPAAAPACASAEDAAAHAAS